MTELPVTWKRVFKVWWLLLWRTFVFSLLGGGLFGAITGIIGSLMGMDDAFISGLATVVGYVVGNVVFLLMLNMAFRKRFKGFRLAMVSDDEFILSEIDSPPQS